MEPNPLPTIRELTDVSLPVHPGMPTMPGNRATTIHADQRLARGDIANLSGFEISLHAGTHLDAGCHMVAGEPGVEALPLDRVVGPCWVAAVGADPNVSAADLETAGIPDGSERLLLSTRNGSLLEDGKVHPHDYAGLDPDGAEWVVRRGIALVGIDYLGIEPPGRAAPTTHHILMRAGVTIVEGLDLRRVEPGPYVLICLPLPIVGGDGSPVRAVLAR